MPASKAEQVLEALKALLGTVPGAAVDRNSVLPEKIPGGGLIVLRDCDPGGPEQALGGFGSTYYQHAVEIEVYVDEGDAAARDAASMPSSSRSVLRSKLIRRSRRWRAHRRSRLHAHRDCRLRGQRSSFLITDSCLARRPRWRKLWFERIPCS